MAIVVKSLGYQTITASGTATLYTVPTAKSAVVNNIRLVNGDNSGPTPSLRLKVKPSGTGTTARLIHKKDFTLAANASFVTADQVTLGQGDAVQLELMSFSGSTSVACVVSGVERDV